MESSTNSQSEQQTSIWFITGATSGFGQRFALSALSRGDRVVATGRSLEKLEKLVASLKPEYLERVRTEQLDVTSGEEEVKRVVDKAVKHWGGVGYPALAEEGGTKLLRRQFETNLFGVADVSYAALPHLRQSTNGRLVVVGSRSAWAAERKGLGLYAASKAAVNTLTENLMSELEPFNIKVLLVLPGSFRTEGIYDQGFFTSNKIPAYDEMRAACIKRFGSIAGTEQGDPDKAAEAVVDIVQGRGVAKDRHWPSYLVLGEDAEADIRSKCSKRLANLDEWADVTRNVKIDKRLLN
ncbi:hypothetical protein CPB83DRAFT_890452 [Crepidotus variabilis]|uniref:Uncharacterized protein n=1 Tax=Crepidotus variabilis TaxID=179855 RepID=A0A9P6EP37_9AGAR|nr:hypothetical protein CPB83DRAFT_890452 [Crepidotus variabilis]